MLNKAIIGKKVGMTQIFNADGKVIPCTVIEAGPCVVTQLKTEEKDGYNAVQFGFEDVKEARLNKPQKGHLKKAGDSLKKYLKEFRFEDCTMFQLGDVVKADMFVEGDYRRRHRHFQGQGLRRRYQAFQRFPSEGDPRYRTGSPSRWFHGRVL